jgi:hypothetical protein
MYRILRQRTHKHHRSNKQECLHNLQGKESKVQTQDQPAATLSAFGAIRQGKKEEKQRSASQLQATPTAQTRQACPTHIPHFI